MMVAAKYFITSREGETGRRLAGLERRIKEAHDAQIALSKELGFAKWRPEYRCVVGGFSSCVFDREPDPVVWRRDCLGGFMPRITSRRGRAIIEAFKRLPVVRYKEVRELFGLHDPSKIVGFTFDDPEFFGFVIGADWEAAIPEDCTEVTITRYNRLRGGVA